MKIFGRANSADKRQQGLKHWCEDFWPVVYRYTYYYVQNREEAEDITQETYIRALKKRPSPDDLPGPGYLKTVALNLIRDRWRRAKVSGTHVPLEEYMLSSTADEDAVDMRNLVQSLMEKLPPDYRLVLELRVIQGYSRAETASRMGRSEDAIRGLQYRAVQSLKTLLTEHLKEVDKK